MMYSPAGMCCRIRSFNEVTDGPSLLLKIATVVTAFEDTEKFEHFKPAIRADYQRIDWVRSVIARVLWWIGGRLLLKRLSRGRKIVARVILSSAVSPNCRE